MTIADFGNYEPAGPKDGVRCTWFDGNRRIEDVFDRAVLKPDTAGKERVVSRG